MSFGPSIFSALAAHPARFRTALALPKQDRAILLDVAGDAGLSGSSPVDALDALERAAWAVAAGAAYPVCVETARRG